MRAPVRSPSRTAPYNGMAAPLASAALSGQPPKAAQRRAEGYACGEGVDGESARQAIITRAVWRGRLRSASINERPRFLYCPYFLPIKYCGNNSIN
jgi:hypothetical protein